MPELSEVFMGAFLGCAAVLNVVGNGVHGIPRRRRGPSKQKPPQRCLAPLWWLDPGRKASQHSTLFGKIAIFIECCDGFYCKAKSTTKVLGPFVVEMTFAQIKPFIVRMAAGFQNVIEANQVCFHIGIRVRNGIADTRLRTEVHYDFRLILLKDRFDHSLVCQIAFYSTNIL